MKFEKKLVEEWTFAVDMKKQRSKTWEKYTNRYLAGMYIFTAIIMSILLFCT